MMDGYRLDKAARIIEAYHHKVDLVVVLLDQHCNPEDKVVRMEERIKNSVSEEARRKLRIIRVVRAIEAWVLADQEALRSICSEASFTGNPEEPHDPAEALRRELEKCGKIYIKTPKWGEHLGLKVDPERVASGSRSFREFRDTLKDP